MIACTGAFDGVADLLLLGEDLIDIGLLETRLGTPILAPATESLTMVRRSRLIFIVFVFPIFVYGCFVRVGGLPGSVWSSRGRGSCLRRRSRVRCLLRRGLCLRVLCRLRCLYRRVCLLCCLCRCCGRLFLRLGRRARRACSCWHLISRGDSEISGHSWLATMEGVSLSSIVPSPPGAEMRLSSRSGAGTVQ